MSEIPPAGGTGDNPPGGTGGDTPPAGSSDKQVPWDAHQNALRDLHRFKDQTKVQATQMADLQAQIEALNGKIATNNKDFESLWAQEKGKREGIEGEKKKLLESVVQNERYRAVLPALKSAGLRDDALNLIDHMDLGAVDIEATSSGRFVCSGVEAFVEGIKGKYPYAFAKPQPPNVNGSSGNGVVTGEPWTPSKLFALETECKKKGDLAPWKRAVAEWQLQKQGKPTS